MTIAVYLTTKTPEAPWSAQAPVSLHDNQVWLHVDPQYSLRRIQKAARALQSMGINAVELCGEQWSEAAQWAFANGFTTAKGGQQITWHQGDQAVQTRLQQRMKAVSWLREVTNAAPQDMTPSVLAQRAETFIRSCTEQFINTRWIDDGDLLAQGYVGVHSVGRGSSNTPVFLEIDVNAGAGPVAACLVGKGITFDSGGYSIKSSEGMLHMKCDMGGAATVTAALGLALMQGLNRHVKLFLCCAENLIAGNAYKLGDILHYRNGVSVEVVNTDAEGRLVLADGLIDATATGAPLIIDAATLTGAAVTALGDNYNALFAQDHDLLQQAQAVAAEVSEPVWPLPLEPWHQEMCPSAYADTANSRAVKGGGAGGASNAAGFLSRFAPENGKGWLHIDLAASFADSSNSLWAAGATGQGVATIARLLLTRT